MMWYVFGNLFLFYFYQLYIISDVTILGFVILLSLQVPKWPIYTYTTAS